MRILPLALVLAGGVASVAATPPELAIRVLSNRADLISGGNALVEILLPADIPVQEVRVHLNGGNVTAAFGTGPSGRVLGLISGMAVGENVVVASHVPVIPVMPRPSAQITITNHPLGGPIFSGQQLQPWVCARSSPTVVSVTVPGTSLTATVTTRVSGLPGPTDAQCNATTRRTYYYQPKSLEGTSCLFAIEGANRCFEPYSLTSPPPAADIADFTNDRGDIVKSIIVRERGTMDRGIYELVTFHDPSGPNPPWDPQRGWNGKLLWRMGPSSGVSRFQESPGMSVFRDHALRRGFMVATSSLTDHGNNANDTLGAEMLMMVKERIVETFGEIRYTIGEGCSGGSIMQHSISAAYPGLLDAIQPNCSYSDTTTTAIEIVDCGALHKYYATLAGSSLTQAQRAAINGHNTTGFCQEWIGSYLQARNPSLASNCGSGWPTALTYSTTSTKPRPEGVRCDAADHDVGMVDTFVDVDGYKKANQAIDNEGVQYGLAALRAGTITAEQFVRLNEGVGSYTPDLVWTGKGASPGNPAPRRSAQPEALQTYYSAGLVSDGQQLAKLPIIDLRGNESPSGDIHMNWRAWATRDRIQHAVGDHENHLIWGYAGSTGATVPSAALLLESLLTLDTWLAAIEADQTDYPIADKVRRHKPPSATDKCPGVPAVTDLGLSPGACPSLTFKGSPRQAAGGPLAENVFKCALKPRDFASPDYAGITFDTDQQIRLGLVFPDGVCDWTKAGVGQVPENAWTTFAAGPGGQPLGDPPVSVLLP